MEMTPVSPGKDPGNCIKIASLEVWKHAELANLISARKPEFIQLSPREEGTKKWTYGV
jgi:hypothetical protein